MHGRHLSCARLPRHSTPSPERRAPDRNSLAIPERSVSLRASWLADAAGARERASAPGRAAHRAPGHFYNIFQFSHFSQLGLFCATSSHRARTCAASPFGKCFQNQNYVTTLRKKARTRSKNKVFAQNVALCAFRRDSNLFFTLIMGAGRACLTAELSRCDWHSR